MPRATQTVLEAELKQKASRFQPRVISTLMDSAPEEVFRKGPWVYVWPSRFAVHLKPSPGCLLIGHTPKQNKKSKKKKRKRKRERDLRSKSSLFALNSNIMVLIINFSAFQRDHLTEASNLHPGENEKLEDQRVKPEASSHPARRQRQQPWLPCPFFCRQCPIYLGGRHSIPGPQRRI